MTTAFYISSGKKLYLYNDIEEITEDKGIYGTITVDYNWDKLEQERVLINIQMFNEALKSITSIRQNAFRNCTQLEGEFVIPSNITSIGGSAFEYCTGLTSITIPNSVTSIGERAFFSCSNILEARVSNEVSTIGQQTFGRNTKLKYVSLGSNITYIGSEAFWECKNLKVFICKTLVPPTINTNTFLNSYVGTIYVPDESVEAYKEANVWSTYAAKIKPLSEYVES